MAGKLTNFAVHRAERRIPEINLVPILDMMVTMIFFLMYTAAFIEFAKMESPAPIVSSDPTLADPQRKDIPVQPTLLVRPFEIVVQAGGGRRFSKVIPTVSQGQYDLEALRNSLLELKKEFPGEDVLFLKPDSAVKYDNIIKIVDTSRQLRPTDPAIFKKNLQGVDEPIKLIFSRVVFANLNGLPGEDLK